MDNLLYEIMQFEDLEKDMTLRLVVLKILMLRTNIILQIFTSNKTNVHKSI